LRDAKLATAKVALLTNNTLSTIASSCEKEPMKPRHLCLFALLLVPQVAVAELRMCALFGDSMVVQRDKPIHVWGWTKPGTEVSVEMAGKLAVGSAGGSGRFDLSIDPLPAGGPHEMVIKADQTRTIKDVLVGEVWICSGQSNMAWQVSNANDADLESLSANYPNIRLISVPQVGTQDPQDDFQGKWEACTPETVKTFSAVGYFFGRQLHQTLDVPIGLIDNAWGGSAAEAWVRRDLLEEDGKYGELLQKWDDLAASYDHEAEMEKYKQRLAKWQTTKQGNRPRPPRNQLTGNHRPANIYNGVLKPTIGYTIRGVIWYQGESNASRAYQYRDLFPLMIQNWRDDWQQDDFPFYWVQLADFQAEVDEPGPSTWAELREAQTMTISRLANTGEAVIIDLGEASDIHPRNKQDVAKRLARWALANDYGIKVPYQSPTYKSWEVDGGKAIVKFDHVGGGLDTFDVREPIGFTIAGEDQKFVHALAKVVGKDTIEVWNDEVAVPKAVRYAWANNPICNVQSAEGLPMTPFRTDDWPGATAGVVK
jgi:sialate O-acetylesterase